MKIQVLKTLLILVVISIFSCKKENIDNNNESVSIKVTSNEVLIGEEITFTLQNVAETEVKSVNWELGEDKKISGFTVTYAYSIPDNYTITANVSFTNGENKEYKTQIIVNASELSSESRVSISESLKDGKYKVCAHRGYWKEAPENSLKAIQQAIDNNIDFIEIDVRMSKDSKLVLMHNSTVDDTTNGKGKVSEMTLEELKNLYLFFNGYQTSEKIPTLTEALMEARGKIYVDIDMKISDYRAVYNIVKQCGMLSQCIFTVYELQDASNVLNIDKSVSILPVVYTMEDLDSFMALNKDLYLVQFNSQAWTNEILKKAYNNGISGFMNVYVNDSDTPASDNYQKVEKFINLGGTVAQTDYPVELKKYLENK